MALVKPQPSLGPRGHVHPSGGGVDRDCPAAGEAETAAAGARARWIFTGL